MEEKDLVGTGPSRVASVGSPAETPATASPDGTAIHAQATTCAAVALGWQTAQLYLAVAEPFAAPVTESDELPSTLQGRPSRASALRLGVMQMQAGIARLKPALTAVGLYNEELELPADFCDRESGECRQEIMRFNDAARQRLFATDYRIGKGYILGRTLADVCLAPPLGSGAASCDGVQCKLTTVCECVQDLRSVLPDHAAKPVLDDVDMWRRWLQAPVYAVGQPADLADEAVGTEVRTALGRQGRMWRALLSGEKSATDVLSAENYFDAGQSLLSGYQRMLTTFLRHWWPYVVTAGLAIAGVAVVLLVVGGGTAGAIGAAATALAGIGITGKTFASAVSNAMTPIERSLAQAEIDTAVGFAAARLPFDLDPRQLRPRPARRVRLRRLSTRSRRARAASPYAPRSWSAGTANASDVTAASTHPI